MRLKHLSITVFLIFLSSCAPQFKTVPQEVVLKMDADLKSGNCQLSNDISHQTQWVSDFRQLVSFYNTSQWHSLAFSVMQIGYENDIAYFFLGSAAEGLGYHDAASKYYNASKTLYSDNQRAHHCRESAEGCGELKLDALFSTKFNATEQRLLASSSASKQASPSPTSPATPSSKQTDLIKNNFTYDLDNNEQLTTNTIKNLNYKIHIHKSQFDESPQYELVKFSNGEFAGEEASIAAFGIGKISKDSDGAALILSSFAGGNAYEYHLCVITNDGNKYHVTQALLNLYAVRIKHLTVKNGGIFVSILYRGPGEATCCPTQKGTLEFKLANDKIEQTKSISFPRVW